MNKKNLLQLKSVIFLALLASAIALISWSCSSLKTVVAKTINNQQDTLQRDGIVKVFEPKNGRLMDSLTIQAMDGSFILQSGKPFKPTFYTPGWVNPNADFVKAFKYSTKGRKVKITIKRAIKEYEGQASTPTTAPTTTSKTIDNFLNKQTESKDTRAFKIKYITEVLYGLLEFNTVHEACSNEPTTRAYYLSIPENYIQSAKGGNISVVYEYYQCEPIVGKGKNKYTSWVLWLSDIEF